MEGFISSIEKLFANRYFTAVKKAFTITLPLIVVGSIASLINNIPIDFVQNFLSTPVGAVIRSVNGGIWLGTSAILAILILCAMGYYLSREFGLNGIMGALAATGSYFAICVTTEDGGIALDRLGAGGLFGAMLIAILSVELYRLFTFLRLSISMGDETSEEVSEMFHALIPVSLTVISISFLNVLVSLSGRNINDWLYLALAALFGSVGEGILSALVLVFGIHLFWFFGIHGGNVLDGVMNSVYGDVLARNVALYAANGDAFSSQLTIINRGFLDVFVFMGGAGTTLCVIIAILLIGRSRYLRSIGKMGSLFSIFNMNEIVLFGVPIILNPLLFIPFIGTPMVVATVSWAAMRLGLVARTVEVVHWAMPPLISGYLATGGHFSGAVLQLLNIALGVVIYLPFIRMLDRKAAIREAHDTDLDRLENTLSAVMDKVRGSTRAINQDIGGFADELGDVSGELAGVTESVGQQMKMLQECTAYIESITASMNDTNSSVHTVLENAENTLSLSNSGVETMTATTVQMQEIYDATASMNDLTDLLGVRCGQISSFLKTIKNISMNTTILALNASVEASRAGLAGRGFQVVAGDIKRLAASSEQAVFDITELLQGMEKDTTNMAAKCRANQHQVEEGQAQIVATSALFRDIAVSVHNVKEQSLLVFTLGEQVTAELEQVKTQIYTTNEFFGATAGQISVVSDKVSDKSRHAVDMVRSLQALDDETNALAQDVFRHGPDEK